jgi:hypothetical protein
MRSTGCFSRDVEWNVLGRILILRSTVSNEHGQKLAAIGAYESVFQGEQASLFNQPSRGITDPHGWVIVQVASSAPRSHATFTSTARVLAFAFFGTVTISKPFLNSALTFSASTNAGKANERAKVP